MGIQKIIEGYGLALKKKTAKEYCCPCPLCGGTDRFCVWPEDNKAWCRGCGWAGDDIQLIIDRDHLSFTEAAKICGRTDKIKDAPPSEKKGTLIEKYNYVDETGSLLFQTLRYDPKGFSQRRPGTKQRWINDIKGTRLVLYDLPNIISSSWVIMVEGEKDVLAIKSLGLPGTCNPMGSSVIKKQHEEHGILNPLQGKAVAIIPDNDKVGKDHADTIAALLQGIASSIKIVNLPSVPVKGDVSDWLPEHDTHPREDLLRLISDTPIWTPKSNFIDAHSLLAMVSSNHMPIIRGGILSHGGQLLIAGASGVGKSMIRLELAIHLSMGWDWLKYEIPQPRKVAIFQYENTPQEEKYRFKKMLEGLKIENFNGSIRWMDRGLRPNLSKVGDREKLAGWVKESGAEVIIYDCLTNIHAANENDNVKMREVLDILTDINVHCNTTAILIHHFGKDQALEGQPQRQIISRIRGASSLTDWASTVMGFTFKPNREHQPIFELQILKLREGPLHKFSKPIVIKRSEYLLSDEIGDISLCSPDRVLELLEELGGASCTADLTQSIEDDVNCSARQAKRFIHEAVKKKQIYMDKSGRNVFYKSTIYGTL